MYSLNAPPPPSVEDLRRALERDLSRLETRRSDPSIVVKRFGDVPTDSVDPLADRVERSLRGWGPIAAAIDRIDVFETPSDGGLPVLHLPVDSPGIQDLHGELVEAFGVERPEVEGPNYVPHLTLGRGGDRVAIERLCGADVGEHRWTVTELVLRDDTYGRPVRRYRLPV